MSIRTIRAISRCRFARRGEFRGRFDRRSLLRGARSDVPDPGSTVCACFAVGTWDGDLWGGWLWLFSAFLDRQFTVWGQIESGMEFVDALPVGEPPANPGKIVKATIA